MIDEQIPLTYIQYNFMGYLFIYMCLFYFYFSLEAYCSCVFRSKFENV